jgi:hypothetical protein
MERRYELVIEGKDGEGPHYLKASSDKVAKGIARTWLRHLGFRVDSTFRPCVDAVQGWNLGRHQGCATALLVRKT